MQTYQEIIIIVFFLSAVLFSLKVAMGAPTPEQDYNKILKNAKDALKEHESVDVAIPLPLSFNSVDKNTADLVSNCAREFESGDGSNYLKLCDKLMSQLHNICEEQFYAWCTGTAWSNYDTSKHVKEKK